jgi:hypothetical protein
LAARYLVCWMTCLRMARRPLEMVRWGDKGCIQGVRRGRRTRHPMDASTSASSQCHEKRSPFCCKNDVKSAMEGP